MSTETNTVRLPSPVNWHEANERAKQRHADHLAAKVAGQNKVNAAANEYERQLIEAFRPFIGTKILTHDGIAKRVKPHIPAAPAGVRVWRAGGTYSLYYEMDVSELTGEYGCCYCKATAYVGQLKGYDLESVGEPQKPRRTDWTVEEVRAKRKALSDARDAMSAAQSQLGNFGEYDQ